VRKRNYEKEEKALRREKKTSTGQVLFKRKENMTYPSSVMERE
jgi:hypothetical protein